MALSRSTEMVSLILGEFSGNDMDLRAFVAHELGKRTYAYCTMAGCHWWLEF